MGIGRIDRACYPHPDLPVRGISGRPELRGGDQGVPRRSRDWPCLVAGDLCHSEQAEGAVMEGWICPSCKRGVAPSEKHCGHGGALAYPAYLMPNIAPTYTGRPSLTPPYEITCGIG